MIKFEKIDECLFEINKLTSFYTPYEKLSAILMVHTQFKVRICETHLLSNKKECEIKEKLTIVFLILLLKSSLNEIKSDFSFIDDYTSFYAKCDYERKVLKTMKDALDLIINYE